MSDKAENASPDSAAKPSQAPRSESKAAQNGSFSIIDDQRLRYIGFDVGPSKIGELFKSKTEEEKYLKRIREKHQKDDVFRDTSNFREERLSGGEKIALIIASLVVLLVFFLPVTPMISGYIEIRTELGADGKVVEPEPPATTDAPDATDAAGIAVDEAVDGVTNGAQSAQSAQDGAQVVGEESADQTAGAEEAATEAEATPPPKTSPSGFQDVQVSRKRTKIDKIPHSWSGLQLLMNFGSLSGYVFSSGIFVIVCGIVLLLYVLSCLIIPLYILMKVFTIKGSADDVAVKLKGVLRLGWAPLALFALLLLLSLGGGSYGGGLDQANTLKQIGESFSIATVLGLLGPGFYIALGGFVLAGAKSVEI